MWRQSYIGELKQEALPCLTSAGRLHVSWLEFFSALCISVTDPKSALSNDLEATDILWQAVEFANTKSAINENQLYLEILTKDV